ncbi:hypothetical protein ACAX60_000772 [Serratia marcescens]|nr:hypothetical protein SMKC058_23330 [Serratia marcescens]
METGPGNSFGKLIHIIKKNYGWIIGISSPISILLCFLTLWTYTRYIGRPDIFGESIEATPQTILILFTATLSFMAFIFLIFAPSIFLVQGRLGLDINKNNRKKSVRYILTITIVNMILLALSLLTAWAPNNSALWLVPGAISSLFLTWLLLKKNFLTTGFWASLFITGGSLFISAACSTFSLLLIYADNQDSPPFLLTPLWLSIMFLSLTPGLIYLYSESNSATIKLKRIALGISTVTMLIILFTPSLLNNVSHRAMSIARLIDLQPRYYQVSQSSYNTSNLEKVEWNIDNINENSYRIIAFSLYNFGSKRLLCPISLAKKPTPELRKHTHQCVLFDKSALKTLNGFT